MIYIVIYTNTVIYYYDINYVKYNWYLNMKHYKKTWYKIFSYFTIGTNIAKVRIVGKVKSPFR